MISGAGRPNVGDAGTGTEFASLSVMRGMTVRNTPDMKWSNLMLVRIIMTCLLALVVALVCAGLWTFSPAAAEPTRPPVVQIPDEEVADFMKSKLASLNAAMEAAANDDFEMLAKTGFELGQLSKEAAWKRQSNATYQQDTADFVAAADFLQRMAESEDSEGVTAAYAAVATSCLDCHRHARRPNVASLSAESSLPVAMTMSR